MGWRNNGNGPCKDCADRYPGCHDHCDRFKEWHEKVAARNKAERDFRMSQDIVSERAKRNMWKKLRYNRKSRPPR